MIRGVDKMFYSDDAAGLRAFLGDKLGLPAADVGGGWPIRQLSEADLGVGEPAGWSRSSTRRCTARDDPR